MWSGIAPFNRAFIYLTKFELSVHLDSKASADVLPSGKNNGHPSIAPRFSFLDYSGRNSMGRFFPLHSVFIFTHSEAFVHLDFLRSSSFLGFPDCNAPQHSYFMQCFYGILSCLQEICTLCLIKGYNVFSLSMYRWQRTTPLCWGDLEWVHERLLHVQLFRKWKHCCCRTWMQWWSTTSVWKTRGSYCPCHRRKSLLSEESLWCVPHLFSVTEL